MSILSISNMRMTFTEKKAGSQQTDTNEKLLSRAEQVFIVNSGYTVNLDKKPVLVLVRD